MREMDTCIRCGIILRVSSDDYQPVDIPGKGGLCAECYNAMSSKDEYLYFHGL